MQQLLDAVKQVKQTIQAHKSDLMNNEALTRYALVDVILNALGWDVHNPAKVFPEYTKGMNNGRADYALLGDDGKTVAILEAKKLTHISNQDLYQVTTYAYHGGIKYSLATDGNIWMVADAFKPVPSPEKEIMRLDLANEPENLLLLKLISLMPTNLNAGNNAFFISASLTNFKVLANQTTNEPVVKPVKAARSSASPSKSIDSNPLVDAGWIPLSKVINAINKPTKVKLPDGTTALTGSSYAGVLKVIAEWLVKTQKISHVPIEDYFKRKRYILNTTPVHKDGANFKSKNILSNGWHLETNYDSEGCGKNAIWLLQLAGENPDDYYFQ